MATSGVDAIRRAVLAAAQHYKADPMSDIVAAPHRGAVPPDGSAEARPAPAFWALTIGSIGVVYGDIGTSPLYALREAVSAAIGSGGTITRAAVLGVLSLILGSLIVVVT